MQEDIVTMVQEEDVEFIRLQFTDILGDLKNMAVTSNQLSKILKNECKFDGSEIEGFVGDDEADLYLHPITGTFETFPWRPQQGKVARMVCDIYRQDGEPFEGDPRYVLRRAVEHLTELGYGFEIGPECEFFLFNTDDNTMPTTKTMEKAGFFDVGPLDFGENARRDMVLALEDMGFVAESSHHEKSPAQHEICFRYDEALNTADNIMTFKLAVRTIARRHGLHATFMPKPREDVNGSGMRLNMNLTKDGRNCFRDSQDPNFMTKEAYYFLGGLMKHMKGISAIANPLVNSYKRLATDSDAPTVISWSKSNRNTLFRIPTIRRGEGTRIELGSPDPAANPYLVIALCLEAGLDGLVNKIEPPEKLEQNVNLMSDEELEKVNAERLPKTLMEALDYLEEDMVLMNALGEHVAKKYIALKRAECERYCKSVTQWELEEYLYKY
ncbi:MAG: type I glutamate--ammonia ligase [Lachnospiraceae bacterium]|nr:type I glutamate--ammonia ligase [Lachnospiraceae bacterium]